MHKKGMTEEFWLDVIEVGGGLTLAPLAAVGVQVVGVQPLGFVQTI